MELIINPQPIRKVSINLGQLRRHLAFSTNLAEAITSNTRITESIGHITEADAQFLLLNYPDWTHILYYTTQLPPETELQFQYHVAQYKDKITYAPGIISEDKTHIVLEEKRSSGQSYVLLHNLPNVADFAIKEYLALHAYKYGTQKWVIVENRETGR